MLYRFSDNAEKKNESLKIIAILSMLIDHVGAVFFPEQAMFRIIGRLAFPIFAFYVANGAYHTSNLRKYLVRLWVFALVSQIPYTLLWDTTELNVLFTFSLAVFAIDRLIKREWQWMPLLAFILWAVPMDYGWYGVMMVTACYFLRDKNLLVMGACTVLSVIVVATGIPAIQLYALVGVGISLWGEKLIPSLQLNRYIFYWFYPVHLLVLMVLKYA